MLSLKEIIVNNCDKKVKIYNVLITSNYSKTNSKKYRTLSRTLIF